MIHFRTLMLITATWLLAIQVPAVAQTENNDQTAAKTAENDNQTPSNPKEICEEIIEQLTKEASTAAPPEQVSTEAFLNQINEREERGQVSVPPGQVAGRSIAEARRAEAEQLSNAVSTANRPIVDRVKEARELLKAGKVGEAAKLLKDVKDTDVPALKRVVARTKAAADGRSQNFTAPWEHPRVKLGSDPLIQQLQRMAADRPTQQSEPQLVVQQHEIEGTAATLPGRGQDRGTATPFSQDASPAAKQPPAATNPPHAAKGAPPPQLPGTASGPTTQQPPANTPSPRAATAPSAPTSARPAATGARPTPATTPQTRTSAQQPAASAAPSSGAATTPLSAATSQRPSQPAGGQPGRQHGASGSQAQQGHGAGGTGRDWNPQLEGRLGPTGGGVGRDWNPRLEGRLGPTGGGVGSDWKGNQDIRAYDRQHVALVTGDGRKVTIKPLINALQKVAPAAAKDPLVRHAPPIRGGREVVRLSPAVQRAIVEKRDQLRHVGGVELDVTFQMLSLLGVPEMRTEGPAILIENPIIISLRRLVDAAKPYATSPDQWQRLPDDIRYPGGIGRIHGYVLDPDTKDVLVVGTPATRRETRLDIDLFTVLMETVWAKGLTPGISLDPRPDDLAGLQYSRIINLPSDALVTRIMLDADYEMKRINFGLVNVADPHFKSLADIIRRETPKGRLSTRFWFRPIPLNPNTVRVSSSGNVVLYDAGVQLLTETMKVQKAGMTGTGEADPVATRAAEEFTRVYARFETSAAVKPQGIYALLHGVTDIVTMCKILRESEIDFPVLEELRGLPYQHLTGKDAVRIFYPGVKVNIEGIGAAAGNVIVLSGGVQLRSRPTRRSLDQFDDYVGNFLEQTAENFRSGDFVQRLSLTFTLPAQQIGGSPLAEIAKLAGLRELAEKRPDSASRRFRDATVKDPTDVDAWVYLALAEVQAGRNAEAGRAIEQAQALDPNDALVKETSLQIAWLVNPKLMLDAVESTLRRELSVEYTNKAYFALSTRNFHLGIESADKAIQLWPDNVLAYLIRGEAYSITAKYDRAIHDYDQAVRLDPSSATAFFDRGLAYQSKGDNDRAIEDYTQAIRLYPTGADAFVNRGNVYAGKHDYDRAIQDYDQAIRLNPKLALAFINRGKTYDGKGDDDRAIQDYDQAIRLDSSDGRTFSSRGLSYAKKGDNDRAIQDYDQAIRLEPNDAIHFHLRGQSYAKKGDHDRAVLDYDHAIGLDPKRAEVFYDRGRVYASKGDYDRAITDYDHAIRLEPKRAAFSDRGLAYANKGDFDRAIQDFDQAIRLDPKRAATFSDRGLAYARKGDFDRAIQDFDQAIQVDPKRADDFYARGLAYQRTGNVDRAIQNYDQVIRLNPKDFRAFGNRARAYESKGDFDRAIHDYDQLIHLDPNNARGFQSRGMIYAQKDNADRAIQDYDRAIQLDPSYASAFYLRGLAYAKKGQLDRAVADLRRADTLGFQQAGSLLRELGITP
jgi:tetratricopeptide (TPR) repeat protein